MKTEYHKTALLSY